MDNRAAGISHGEALSRTRKHLISLLQQADVLVREKGFSRYGQETQALFKAVGVSDLASWELSGKSFDEIAPASVKKLVTGTGKASKEQVREALEHHVGERAYACDDESDAVAVGVAWLIQNNLIGA